MERNTDQIMAGGLLAFAILVGGAGAAYPLIDMMLGSAAIGVAAYFAATPRHWKFARLNVIAIGLLGLILLLPVLQLVPLPPALWQLLPGRTLAVEVDAALNWNRWRPLTLDAEGTIRALLSMVPAAAMFMACMFLSWRARCQLLWIVLAGALLSALLGIVQMATGGSFTPYTSGHLGNPIGLFVNRNHQAAFMLIAMLVAGAIGGMQIARGRPRIPWVAGSLSAIVMLALIALGTTSRMALTLLPLALAGGLLLLFLRHSTSRLMVTSAVVFAALGALVFASGAIDRVLARFSGFSDPRLSYWTDIQWALDQYGLAGTGFGTFVPVYKSAESLEAVVGPTTNHAHNDYLEILLEGGWPAALLLVLFAGIMAAAILRLSRSNLPTEQKLPIGAAIGGIVILLAWSVVDFPLRMTSLMMVFALLFSILLPGKLRAQPRSGTTDIPGATRIEPRVRLVPVSLSLVLLAILTGGVVQAGMSSHHLQRDRLMAARDWAPWSTRAYERLSTRSLLRNDMPEAESAAVSALKLSPISAPAVRSIGLIRISEGKARQGNALMQVALSLGWRDPLTQLWAIQAAIASREPEKALQRAEALFQQEELIAPATILLLRAPPQSGITAMLAARLAEQPAWRRDFFKSFPSAAGTAGVRVASMLARSKAPITPEESEPWLDALVDQGSTTEAAQLWSAMRGEQLLTNGDFQSPGRHSDDDMPSGWHVPRALRGQVSVGPEPSDGSSLALRVQGNVSGGVLYQRLLLPPGSYRLAYRARAGNVDGAQIRWELRCSNAEMFRSEPITIQGGQWQPSQWSLTVPVRNCAIQQLVLVATDAHDGSEIWFDDIELERISN